ncbi:Transcriptional regulator, TetR family [Lachnospiraceae bacterium TWA4]|nr:Transcriptional regulator, TetR family [Lachnospiraceae bacterium TWA4]
MASDMKQSLARAVITLLFEKNQQKITVKDIVKECHITRQAFYYHFTDIPDLIQWIIKQGKKELYAKLEPIMSPEERIHQWFSFAVNAMPYIRKSMRSNYGKEIKEIIFEQVFEIFLEITNEEEISKKMNDFDRQMAIRYHCYAIDGILQNWTEEDTKNLDQIAHNVYVLITGQSG